MAHNLFGLVSALDPWHGVTRPAVLGGPQVPATERLVCANRLPLGRENPPAVAKPAAASNRAARRAALRGARR